MGRRYSRITLLMEAFVVRLLQAAANISRVSSLIGLDWHTVNTLIKRAVERGLLRRQAEPVRQLGLHEKSFASGYNYASVLSDQRVVRRSEVQADHVAQLLDEERVVGQLEAFSAMRLQTKEMETPLHTGRKRSINSVLPPQV